MVVNFYGKPSQKWYRVILFGIEPRESYRTSDAGVEYARFRCQGDAWNYAKMLMDANIQRYPTGLIVIH